MKAELEKLAYLRRLDAHTLDLSMLPAERRRFLAGVGRRLTGQALQRREPERRYPILLTLLVQSAVDVLDETLLLFDQAISGREAAAKQKVADALAERAKGGENRQALLDEVLTIVLDPAIGDEQIGSMLRTSIGLERMRAAWAERRERLPRDHGQLSMLDASMSYLRQFASAVLAAVQFAGGPGTEQLLQAVSMLAGLYATGARKVPAGAPVGFVPTKWAGYLVAAEQAGDVTAYRRYWELAVLVGLRDGLRSGDIFVPGSRRYADPASFLLTPEAWAPQKVEFCHLVGKPVEAADALAAAEDELHTALADLEAQLARGNPGEVRLTDDGELIIPPLTAEDVPAEADALRAELAGMLPRVPIASVLVEVDARTGFTDHLVHAGGKVARSAELKRNLMYVIIAEATNKHLSALTSFTAYCHCQDWLTTDPGRRLERRKVTRTRDKAIPHARLERLFTDDRNGLRERVLWRMLYETCARAEEILGLDVPDLDPEFRRALVTEKGGDRAYVHWETPTARLLPRLLAGRTAGPVFLADRRAPGAGRRTPALVDVCPETGRGRLSYPRAEYLFKQASQLHDPHGTGYTLHQLRHSGLTHLAAKGRSAAELQAKSRHRHLATLGIYVRLGEETSARITAENDEHHRRHRR